MENEKIWVSAFAKLMRLGYDIEKAPVAIYLNTGKHDEKIKEDEQKAIEQLVSILNYACTNSNHFTPQPTEEDLAVYVAANCVNPNIEELNSIYASMQYDAYEDFRCFMWIHNASNWNGEVLQNPPWVHKRAAY